MATIKVPQNMIDAVKKLPKPVRPAAKRLAEKTFAKHYHADVQDGEFTDEYCIELASLAAVAAIEYYFG